MANTFETEISRTLVAAMDDGKAALRAWNNWQKLTFARSLRPAIAGL